MRCSIVVSDAKCKPDLIAEVKVDTSAEKLSSEMIFANVIRVRASEYVYILVAVCTGLDRAGSSSGVYAEAPPTTLRLIGLSRYSYWWRSVR